MHGDVHKYLCPGAGRRSVPGAGSVEEPCIYWVRGSASGHRLQMKLLSLASVQGLKGGVHQCVAILRKHDPGAGTRPGRSWVTGRLVAGPAETHAAEKAAEGAAHLGISAGVHHCIDQ